MDGPLYHALESYAMGVVCAGLHVSTTAVPICIGLGAVEYIAGGLELAEPAEPAARDAARAIRAALPAADSRRGAALSSSLEVLRGSAVLAAGVGGVVGGLAAGAIALDSSGGGVVITLLASGVGAGIGAFVGLSAMTPVGFAASAIAGALRYAYWRK